MGEREFSLYDIEQFLREAGADKVTEEAVLNLEREIEKLADKIANKAVRYAAHAGRKKLIKREDILLTRMNGRMNVHVYSRPASLRPKARMTNMASKAHK